MPQRRIYDEPTRVFRVRLSVPTLRLLDWLAGQEGVTPSQYMRAVWEEHLRAEGFEVTPGELGVRDPLWGTPDGWKRERSKPADDVRSRA